MACAAFVRPVSNPCRIVELQVITARCIAVEPPRCFDWGVEEGAGPPEAKGSPDENESSAREPDSYWSRRSDRGSSGKVPPKPPGAWPAEGAPPGALDASQPYRSSLRGARSSEAAERRPTPRPSWRNPLILVVVILLVATGVIAGVFLSGGSNEGSAQPGTPTGSQAFMAFAGGGVGVIGTCPTDASPSATCRLYVTTDYEHFRDITPTGIAAEPEPQYTIIEQAFALDAQNLWVSTLNVADGQLTIYGSVDGGTQWNSVAGPFHPGGSSDTSYLQYLSPTVGYTSNYSYQGPSSNLWATSTGGQSWQPVASSSPTASTSTGQLPVGRVVFFDSTHAVDVFDQLPTCGPSPQGHSVWYSVNGGEAWAPSALPPRGDARGANISRTEHARRHKNRRGDGSRRLEVRRRSGRLSREFR